MKFTNLVALFAIVAMAADAVAANDGLLRRAQPSQSVAQNDSAQAQPTTVVEAEPVLDSKAERLRKARMGQEVQTETKIVEKLEESRLKEEQQRAERLFGDKLEPVTAPVPAPAPAAQATPPPAPAPAEPKAPQQVNIQIIQPVPEKREEKPVERAERAERPERLDSITAESAMETPDESAPMTAKPYYVSGMLALPTYGVGNMKTNYGLGFTVGTLVNPNWALEGSLIYSNHNIDTFWDFNLYREMSQYDIQAVAKYNIMTGNLRPYVGGGAAYVYRKYNDRIKDPRLQYVTFQNSPQSLDTHTVNLVLVGGVDFDINQSFGIGAGLDYNKPVMARNTPNFTNYGLPSDSKPVEEFDYYTFKINARYNF